MLDDTSKGIGFHSFDIIEVLGQGSFGKVYKVLKKDEDPPKFYAMKVLKKSVLHKKNQLKYAVTECNILKHANHPFVVKLHYSF